MTITPRATRSLGRCESSTPCLGDDRVELAVPSARRGELAADGVAVAEQADVAIVCARCRVVKAEAVGQPKPLGDLARHAGRDALRDCDGGHPHRLAIDEGEGEGEGEGGGGS